MRIYQILFLFLTVLISLSTVVIADVGDNTFSDTLANNSNAKFVNNSANKLVSPVEYAQSGLNALIAGYNELIVQSQAYYASLLQLQQEYEELYIKLTACQQDLEDCNIKVGEFPGAVRSYTKGSGVDIEFLVNWNPIDPEYPVAVEFKVWNFSSHSGTGFLAENKPWIIVSEFLDTLPLGMSEIQATVMYAGAPIGMEYFYTLIREPDPPEQIADWVDPPDTYIIGSDEDIDVAVYIDYAPINVVFQTWSVTTEQIEGAFTDYDDPFSYPAYTLNQVTPGLGVIQALIRDENMQVLGRIEHPVMFVEETTGDPVQPIDPDLPSSLQGVYEYIDSFPESVNYEKPILPELPTITRVIEATTREEIENAEAGSKILFDGQIEEGSITIQSNDIELVMLANSKIRQLKMSNGLKRIYVHGVDTDENNFPRIGEVIMPVPASYKTGEAIFDVNSLCTDLLFENLLVHFYPDTDPEWGGSAFLLRAHRCAIVNCNTDAKRYSVWAGNTPWSDTEDPFWIEDVIILNCRFNSNDGLEATVRFVGTKRYAVINTRLENHGKANYRSHGDSDEAWVSDCYLYGGGVYVGAMPEDHVKDHWFLDNTVEVTFLTNVNTWAAHGGQFEGNLELHRNEWVEPTWGNGKQWCAGFTGSGFVGNVNHSSNTLRGRACDDCWIE